MTLLSGSVHTIEKLFAVAEHISMILGWGGGGGGADYEQEPHHHFFPQGIASGLHLENFPRGGGGENRFSKIMWGRCIQQL